MLHLIKDQYKNRFFMHKMTPLRCDFFSPFFEQIHTDALKSSRGLMVRELDL